MKLEEVVAHRRLSTEKKGGTFIYEIILEKSITGLYRMKRRWGYLKEFDKADWKITDWHMKYKLQYERKIVQKTQIMKYVDAT